MFVLIPLMPYAAFGSLCYCVMQFEARVTHACSYSCFRLRQPGDYFDFFITFFAYLSMYKYIICVGNYLGIYFSGKMS